MVELPLNMKKELPMVKLTVITEQVFQTVQVIKMIEPREESRDVPRIVRKEVRIVLIANGLIINQTDKLISWLINNNQREKLVTPTNNMSERPKEAHKVQVWEEAEIELKNRIQMLLEKLVGTLKKKVRKAQSLKIRSKKEVMELNIQREVTEVPMISTTLPKMKNQLLVSWKSNENYYLDLVFVRNQD
jgi:hypothetical protein